MSRSSLRYRVSTGRSKNLVNANPQKMGSPTDKRWATGRNVKLSLPDHRYDVVQVWTCKERDENGKVVVRWQSVSREKAEAFVKNSSDEPCDCRVPGRRLPDYVCPKCDAQSVAEAKP
jgi:hypothetical protein